MAAALALKTELNYVYIFRKQPTDNIVKKQIIVTISTWVLLNFRDLKNLNSMCPATCHFRFRDFVI
jgi:hypothetical protein